MTRILAIETSSDACSVAISDGEVNYSFHELMPRQHTEALIGVIDDLLNSASLDIKDLDAVAVGCGPGSFTGLRIAMAAAKGLAITHTIPLIGISCFEAVAQRVNQGDITSPYDLLLIALNSKREDPYIECRDSQNKKVISGGAINSDLFFVKLKKLIGRDTNIRVVGDGSERLLERAPADIYDNFLAVNEKDKEPLNVCDVARCAFNETSNSIENIRKNMPRLTIDYLRSPDFTLSKN
mgnify:CR=1 FL=1